MKSLSVVESLQCNDVDLSEACVDYCSTINDECIDKCAGNRNCISYCYSNADACVNACPCYSDGDWLLGNVFELVLRVSSFSRVY